MEIELVYRTYRPLLLSIAYRMLGSVIHAEDVVQDAFLTVQQQGIHKESSSVRNLKAYLCKMVTNRCLDYLKSTRKKRELYVGTWLPEPLVQNHKDARESVSAVEHDPLQTIELEDTISYAFLVMLDRLTPIERAVFILREAFEFDYGDIADFLNKTEVGCRKIYSRLKRKIQDEPEVELTPSVQSEQLALRFLQATSSGDMEGLLKMLSHDVALYSDGGGKVVAAIKPVTSSQRVLAFIQGLLSKGDSAGIVRLVKVNGQLGFVLSSPSEAFPTVVSLAFRNDCIERIYILRNPDKLQHLNLG
ncbi:RNA polymerase sigma factor SigJ [Paenibacillus sp. AD87]|uniref:RNA polymerase sigma factor SigJ n=1 Tax=Paenibacillus sp. AD87 TaxID=1528787 RepID=UPI0007E47513|nr:RNA polymerase sigma factor SigJ [Paenibacillus sp. AD87]OAX50684.1 ECF RNA polymerase sigma factor SigJ [Paenibacillus sp. AD87]